MNSGRVELDLVAVGKDQVSAMLKNVEAQAKKTAGEMRTLGEQANRAAPQINALGPAVGEAAKKMTTLSAAIVGGVIGGGISGVVGALTEMIGGLADLAIEFLTTEPRLDSFSEQMVATANDAAKLSTQIDNIGLSARDATKLVAGFGSRIATVSAQIAKMRGQGDLAAAFEQAANVAVTGDAIKGIEESMAKAETAANDARKIVLDLRPKVEKARLDVIAAQEQIKYRESLGLGTNLQRSQLGLAANAHAILAAEVAKTEYAYIAASDAVSKMAEELSLLDTLQVEQGKNRVADVVEKAACGGGGARREAAPFGVPLMSNEGYISEGPDALSQTFENIRDGSAAEAARALAQMRDDAGKLADELGRVADATRIVAEVMPEMSAALSEVQAITAKVSEGKLGLSEALAQGATAIAANAAKAIGGVRAEAAVRAAYEIGMGFATLANPVVSAGHFTAGALLGAVALGAGGGSSGGARSSSGGSVGYVPDSPGKGGGTTIWNISTLVTDPHTLQRANASSARATRGTGIDERSAA